MNLLWDNIVDTQQDVNNLVPPKTPFKDVLTFGNGSAHRFWRIFKGWKASEGGSEIRPHETDTRDYVRLTHRFGIFAKMKYVVNKENVTRLGYTGHYAEGNNCVLARLSSAVPTSVEDRFTPAIAAKFFAGKGHESQVLIAQHDIGGQSSGFDHTVNPPKAKSIDNNFYSKYLSNILSFEKGVLSGVGAFSRFFYTAQYYSRNILKLDYVFDPRELQASHLAQVNEKGDTISSPKGPRFIWVVPPSEGFKNKFGDMAKNDSDFRKHFMSLNKNNSNPGGAAGTEVFKIYGSDVWTYEPEKDAVHIGSLVADSDFVASEAADVRVFFKHAIQFHPIPEAEGKPNPYSRDYSYNEWNEQLFTDDCALGARASEIEPSEKDELNGSFLKDAIVFNPRIGKNGEWCFGKIMTDKIKAELGPKLEKKKVDFTKYLEKFEPKLKNKLNRL